MHTTVKPTMEVAGQGRVGRGGGGDCAPKIWPRTLLREPIQIL